MQGTSQKPRREKMIMSSHELKEFTEEEITEGLDQIDVRYEMASTFTFEDIKRIYEELIHERDLLSKWYNYMINKSNLSKVAINSICIDNHITFSIRKINPTVIKFQWKHFTFHQINL